MAQRKNVVNIAMKIITNSKLEELDFPAPSSRLEVIHLVRTQHLTFPTPGNVIFRKILHTY